MDKYNPYKKVYRTRTERIILNAAKVDQQRRHEEYVENLALLQAKQVIRVTTNWQKFAYNFYLLLSVLKHF